MPLSSEEWIKNLWYIYTMEYYLVITNKENLPLTTTWMKLEAHMLSEISQAQKEYRMLLLIYRT